MNPVDHPADVRGPERMGGAFALRGDGTGPHRLAATINTNIRMHLHAEGDLDGAQRARLVQIAQLCPVHKTLQHPIHIETTLAA
ncbi:MAG: OsmC family protein [Flavobacteriales bacterium]|nr:OsmC family protein [Flavobacteriales bacterium]